MTKTIILESTRHRACADGRRRTELRLVGNPAGFWIERRRPTFMRDRIMHVYERLEILWDDTVEGAVTSFLALDRRHRLAAAAPLPQGATK